MVTCVGGDRKWRRLKCVPTVCQALLPTTSSPLITSSLGGRGGCRLRRAAQETALWPRGSAWEDLHRD